MVSLIGAGPGDPDLHTVQAIEAIRHASVLLVDDLVGTGMLLVTGHAGEPKYRS